MFHTADGPGIENALFEALLIDLNLSIKLNLERERALPNGISQDRIQSTLASEESNAVERCRHSHLIFSM